MRPISFLLPICLLFCTLASAGPQSGLEKEHVRFHNIVFQIDGNKVRDVCQDSSGLMWIGTSTGLLSYDGFKPTLHQGWDHDYAITEIFDIHPYKGYLALGTEKGLRFFDPLSKSYCNPFPELNKLPSARYIHNEGDTLYFIGRNEKSYRYKDGKALDASYDGTYLLTVNLRNCTWKMDKQ